MVKLLNFQFLVNSAVYRNFPSSTLFWVRGICLSTAYFFNFYLMTKRSQLVNARIWKIRPCHRCRLCIWVACQTLRVFKSVKCIWHAIVYFVFLFKTCISNGLSFNKKKKKQKQNNCINNKLSTLVLEITLNNPHYVVDLFLMYGQYKPTLFWLFKYHFQ